MRVVELPVASRDGHRFTLEAILPENARGRLLWLPALGVSARHYRPFAEALAKRGVAAFLHEWRGHGSSSLRARRGCDWGYRDLLLDIEASEAAAAAQVPEVRRVLGGHSLGGQLAACRLGLDSSAADALWLVASGAPYWRAFPYPTRCWLPLAYRFLPWLARRVGHLPGRRIGFGGSEAAGVMADWGRSALSGRYAPSGVPTNLEADMARFTGEVRGLALRDDWLGPMSSLQHLTSKLAHARVALDTIDAGMLGTVADHYGWMRHPEALVRILLAPVDPEHSKEPATSSIEAGKQYRY